MAKTLTFPTAVIEINGKPVGVVNNLNYTENHQVQDVRELGTYEAVELAHVNYAATVTIDQSAIKYSSIPEAIRRNVNSTEEFVNTFLLRNNRIDFVVYKREEETFDPQTQTVTSAKLVEFVRIRDAKLTTDSFGVSQGAVATKSMTFAVRLMSIKNT